MKCEFVELSCSDRYISCVVSVGRSLRTPYSNLMRSRRLVDALSRLFFFYVHSLSLSLSLSFEHVYFVAEFLVDGCNCFISCPFLLQRDRCQELTPEQLLKTAIEAFMSVSTSVCDTHWFASIDIFLFFFFSLLSYLSTRCGCPMFRRAMTKQSGLPVSGFQVRSVTLLSCQYFCVTILHPPTVSRRGIKRAARLYCGTRNGKSILRFVGSVVLLLWNICFVFQLVMDFYFYFYFYFQ